MTELKMDVKKYAATHTYCEHICGCAFELGSEVYANYFRAEKLCQ